MQFFCPCSWEDWAGWLRFRRARKFAVVFFFLIYLTPTVEQILRPGASALRGFALLVGVEPKI